MYSFFFSFRGFLHYGSNKCSPLSIAEVRFGRRKVCRGADVLISDGSITLEFKRFDHYKFIYKECFLVEILYGDGIHDDTAAIQELIDSGVCEVSLPVPKVCYLISRPLELPSNFRLVLPRFAEIKLAAGSDCEMLRNKMIPDFAERIEPGIFGFINKFSPDYQCQNIEVIGGIWNCNNLEQKPNPMMAEDTSGYSGMGMLFYNVTNLHISSLTVKDPVTFSITLDTVSYFTVDNITFDFNYGNPLPTNMDGVHLNGNCSFGKLTNLKGRCFDDLIALNAEEGTNGPITNIDIDGIYAEDCHSAVRLLTVTNPVEYISIRNVYGTYYQYCIALTKFYNGPRTGYYDGITLENIYVSKAERYKIYNKDALPICPIIGVDSELYVKNLKISGLFRKEYKVPIDTILIGEKVVVDSLILENISVENHTDTPEMPLMTVNGEIKSLYARNVFADGKKIEF